MCMNYTIDHFGVKKEDWDGSVMQHEILEWFITAITIVVVAVPEGMCEFETV